MLDAFTYLPSILKTDTEYQRNERLKHVVWLAAHGSRAALIRLERMSDENKRNAWGYSTEDIRARLRAVLNAPQI